MRLQNVQLLGPVTMPCDDLREKMLFTCFEVDGVLGGPELNAKASRQS